MEKEDFEKRELGDTSLYGDLMSLIEELTCSEKHSLNNCELNRDKNPKRAKRWKEIGDELRNIRHKWMMLLINKKYDYEELLCECKHLLNASKNFIELSNKLENIPDYSEEALKDRAKLLNFVIEMNEL